MGSHAEAVTVTPALLRDWPLPEPGEDKTARGTALVVAGSRQTPGAVLLAAEAALRAGAGKLQVVTVESLATQLAVALPEALVQGVAESHDGEIDIEAVDTVLEIADRADAILLGPGAMRPEATEELLSALVPSLSGHVVLDAVAMAYVARERGRLSQLSAELLLTPNSGELGMALGVEELDEEVPDAAARLARETGAVVSSGGDVSWTATCDDRLWRDETGGPGLAVSGSGDVKAGVVLGLWARGCDAAQAAVWGSYLHARAGDRLSERIGRVGYLARDILAEIPLVLTEMDADVPGAGEPQR